MNTSFLSAFPSPAPRQENLDTLPVRNAVSATAARAGEVDSRAEPAEPKADHDKADAFAEMLAAMMSNVDSPLETPAPEEPVDTAVAGTAIATDLPRDGAGSPLFHSSFVAPTSTTNTLTTQLASASPTVAVSSPPTAEIANAENATTASATVVNDAAAAALADLGLSANELTEFTIEPAPQVGPEFAIEVDAGVTELDFVDPGVIEARAIERGLDAAPEANPSNVDQTATQAADVDGANRTVAQSQRDATPLRGEADTRLEPPTPATSEPPVVKGVEASAERRDSARLSADGAVETPLTAAPAEPVLDEGPSSEADAGPIAQQPSRPATTVERPAAAPRTTASMAVPARTADMPIEAVEPVGENVAEMDVLQLSQPRSPVDDEGNATAPQPVDQPEIAGEGAADVVAAGSATSASAVSGQSPSAATPTRVSQQVLQALATYEAELPANGARSFELLLDPPELGRLLLQMSRTANGVEVRIAAENEAVRAILESTGQDLQQSLQLSGFDLGQFSGSSSNSAFGGGEEFVFAPARTAFVAGDGQSLPQPTPASAETRAVNVVV